MITILNRYERKIAQELKKLGYNVSTSRNASKLMDDNKIDIVDLDNKLPCYIQLKNTVNIPQYFKISNECGFKDKPFIIIWNKQVKKEINFISEGELVLMPKEFFYELLCQTQKQQK